MASAAADIVPQKVPAAVLIEQLQQQQREQLQQQQQQQQAGVNGDAASSFHALPPYWSWDNIATLLELGQHCHTQQVTHLQHDADLHAPSDASLQGLAKHQRSHEWQGFLTCEVIQKALCNISHILIS